MTPLLELEHLADALKGFKRPSAEGREAMGNLVVVGLKENTEHRAHVQALCVRTTKIDDYPLQISVMIDKKTKNVDEKIQEISCSCPAGASKDHVCKHAFATLLFLQRHEESSLEQFSCTDLEQVWGTLKEDSLKKFQPVPLSEFCHVKKPQPPYRRPIRDVTEEMEKRFRAMFLNDQPESEAAVFLSGVRAPPPRPLNAPTVAALNSSHLKRVLNRAINNPHFLIKRAAEIAADLLKQCSAEEQLYYKDNIAVTHEESIHMCLDTVGQDNDLWDLFKRCRFTGSISYNLFTYSKNKAPNWQKKLSDTFQSTFTGNYFTDQGLMYENDGRDCYVKKHPQIHMVNAGIFVYPLVPWLGFSADGLILNEDGEMIKVFEVKCPDKGNKFPPSEIAAQLVYMDKNGHLKKKHKYQGQVQLGMLLYNTPACDFTHYCIGFDDIAVDTVMLDESWNLEFLESLATVYFKKMLPWLCQRNYNN